MDYPTTTAAALAIAGLLAVVAGRYYRRNRQLRAQIAVLEGEAHFHRQTINQTEAQRQAALRALNEALLANAQLRNKPLILRFNGIGYAEYKVRSVSLN